MPANTNGFSGVDSKMVSDDSFIMVGIDPNTDPACVVDDLGRSRSNYAFSATEGVTRWPSSYPEVKAIDNSGSHHGGTYTIVAMNKFAVDAASGGIAFNTSGNINLYGLGGIVNIVSSAQIELLSDVVKIDSTGFTIIDGPFCDINSDMVTIKNLSVFASNAMVNGSMLVKGELYTTHITGMKDKFYTKPCKPQAIYYHPKGVFKGIMRIKDLVSDGPHMAADAYCQVEMLIPDPQMLSHYMGYTFPHSHRFYHLAADLCSSPTEVWSESMQMAETTKAKAAKSAENSKKKLEKFTEEKIKELTKTMTKQALF